MSADAVSTPLPAAFGRSEGTAPPRPLGTGRILELDGLRAGAIWLVLLAHLFFDPPDTLGRLPGWTRPLVAIGSHGWLGVDLFFVLSGFLITGILLDTKGRADYFSTFYKRRAFRILPIYAIVLVVLLAIYGMHYAQYAALCAFFAANFADFAKASFLPGAGPYWSLSVEEQFYLVWPLLVLALNRRALAIVAGVMIVAEPVLRIVQAHNNVPAFILLTWSRSDGLAIGALLAIWFRSRYASPQNTARLAQTLLGIVAVSVVALWPFDLLSNGDVSTAIRISQAVFVFAALIAWAVSRSGSPSTAFLRAGFARYTAELSYCLYLIHAPLVNLWEWAAARVAPDFVATGNPVVVASVRAVCVLIVAYAVAALSRRFIELPAIRFSHRRTAT